MSCVCVGWLRCNLDDLKRCALTSSSTSTLSAMLQLTRRCSIYMLDGARAGRSRAFRESQSLCVGLVVELSWEWFDFELTMLEGGSGFGVAVAAGLVRRKSMTITHDVLPLSRTNPPSGSLADRYTATQTLTRPTCQDTEPKALRLVT